MYLVVLIEFCYLGLEGGSSGWWGGLAIWGLGGKDWNPSLGGLLGSLGVGVAFWLPALAPKPRGASRAQG